MDRLRRPRWWGRTGRRRAAAVLVLAGVAIASLVAGLLVGGTGGSSSTSVPEASHGSPSQRVSFLAKIVPPEPEHRRSPGPRVPRSVSDLARRLPLERKVAQVFLVGFTGQDLTAVVFRQLRRLDYGGVLIDRGNYTGPQVLSQMAGEAVVISQQEKHVPPWVMAPQEGGEFNAFSDLPPVDAPADLPSARAGAAEAAQSGSTLRALGVSGVLGPSADVGPADEAALGGLLYSDDPRAVAAFVAGAVASYRRDREFSAVEHFPGLGAASQPTDEGPTEVGQSLDDLRRRDLVPFRAAFRAGAPAVVLSHALYSIDNFTTPGSLSPRIATNLLRRRLHFRGVAITDDLADPAITTQSSVPDAAVKALRAGADMLYISGPPGDQQASYVAVLRAVRSGRLPRRRLEEAVGRILLAKKRYGLIR
jgi:beta-N-acetylhexosaminidase